MAFYRITKPDYPEVQYLLNLEHVSSIVIKPSPTVAVKYLLVVSVTGVEKEIYFVYSTKVEAQAAYDDLASYLRVDNDPNPFPSDVV